MASSFYLQHIRTSDVPNVDDILALPSMKDEENLLKLYLVCANGMDKYLQFDKNESVFLQNLENLYFMSTSCFFPKAVPSSCDLGECDVSCLLNGPIESMDESIESAESVSDLESEYEKLTPRENLYRFMKNGGIDFADYLFERSWFVYSPTLQQKVFRLIMQNRGNLLDVMAGDFEEHIDSLLL